MRPVPTFLLLLLLALGLGIAVRVFWSTPAGPSPAAAGESTWPAVVAGVPQGGVYTGIVEEPEDTNPYTCDGAAAWRFVLGYTHDTLLDSDPVTGALRPALASAWELSPDGSTCTFTLRDGVRFSDGAPLTMADVLFGWELAQSHALPMGLCDHAFVRVASAEALDERRLRVTFRDRHYAAVQAVGESWIVGQRRFFVERVAEAAARAGAAAPEAGSAEFGRLLAGVDRECGPGTGPYALVNRPGASTWQVRQDLTLVRNVHCWRRQAAAGTWNFAAIRLLFRDPATAVTALQKREVDWFSSPNADELLRADPALAADYTKLSYDHRGLGVFAVFWNCRRLPFDRAEVRRALAMLFDTDAVLAAFGGNGTRALAFAKPGSPEYPADIEPLPFDPAEARRMLREAGYAPEDGKALHVVLLAPQGLDAMRRTLDLVVDAGKRAGVEIEVRQLEWGAFVEAKRRGEWDGLFVQQTFKPWADPYEFLHSAGLDNHGKFSDAEVDQLAAAARVELDPRARCDLLRRLHELVYREQPAAFLVHPTVSLLLKKRVQGTTIGPLGLSLERAFVTSAGGSR